MEEMGTSSSAHPIPIITPVPELGWLGLEKFQGRQRQPAWQANLVPGATAREAQRFHSNPQTPGLEGSHKSERDLAVFSDVPFLLLVGNFPSQTFPSPLCFLEVEGMKRDLESQQWRTGTIGLV